MKYERTVEFVPAYDKRSSDPNKDYGIGSVRVKFILRKGRKAVQFLFSTDWYLPDTQKEWLDKVHGARTEIPQDIRSPDLHKHRHISGWDIGYHSPIPMYKGQESITEDCPVIGGVCYYDGSSLAVDRYLDILVSEGSDRVWRELEKEWESTFGDKYD